MSGYVIIVVERRDHSIKLYGSPADKDNLEVGDEILDINDCVLENLPRVEVIRFIHEVMNKKNYHNCEKNNFFFVVWTRFQLLIYAN